MKTIHIHLKIVAFLISSIIVLQSCTVYKSTTVTLDQAYKSQTKVKVLTTTDEEALLFKRIDLIDGKYFGISKKASRLDNRLLDENNINSIRILNKNASTILTIGAPLFIVGGIIWIASESISIDPGFSGI